MESIERLFILNGNPLFRSFGAVDSWLVSAIGEKELSLAAFDRLRAKGIKIRRFPRGIRGFKVCTFEYTEVVDGGLGQLHYTHLTRYGRWVLTSEGLFQVWRRRKVENWHKPLMNPYEKRSEFPLEELLALLDKQGTLKESEATARWAWTTGRTPSVG